MSEQEYQNLRQSILDDIETFQEELQKLDAAYSESAKRKLNTHSFYNPN